MTLDEAIQHCEEVATKMECESMCVEEAYQTAKQADCEKCAEEHRQLAEWLKELKGYKDKNEPKLVIYSGDGYADGYMVYDFANCPNCDYEFEDGDDNWNAPYCCRCGQRLKWEEEE